MLTKNFKNMMAMILSSVSGGPGLLPVKDIGGNVRYFGHCKDTSSFPYTRTNSYTANATAQMRYCALLAYGLMLIFNFVWLLLFFRLGMRLVAFVWLVMLFFLILLTASLFERVRRSAGLLFIPYLAWTVFAGDLNFGVYWLNR